MSNQDSIDLLKRRLHALVYPTVPTVTSEELDALFEEEDEKEAPHPPSPSVSYPSLSAPDSPPSLSPHHGMYPSVSSPTPTHTPLRRVPAPSTPTARLHAALSTAQRTPPSLRPIEPPKTSPRPSEDEEEAPGSPTFYVPPGALRKVEEEVLEEEGFRDVDFDALAINSPEYAEAFTRLEALMLTEMGDIFDSVEAPVGSRREVGDGRTIVRHADGRVTTTYAHDIPGPSGEVKELWVPSKRRPGYGTRTLLYKDGSKTRVFIGQGAETERRDGVRLAVFASGERRLTLPDGRKETLTPSGKSMVCVPPGMVVGRRQQRGGV